MSYKIKEKSRKKDRKKKKTKLVRKKIMRIVFLCILIILTYLLVLLVSNLSIFKKEQEQVNQEIKTSVLDKEKENDIEIKEEIKENDNLQELVEKEDVEEEIKIKYVNGVLIVNKNNPVPKEYNPGVNKEAKDAFDEMALAAKEEDLSLYILSGFRSYDAQKKLYESYVKKYGEAFTDTFSAKAGHSEHQTGLAFDVCSVKDVFGDTKESRWLALNAHEFGFVIRYPKGKEDITGYKYEPWHIRYLGKNLATKVYNSGLTLEEYLNVD